MDEILLRAISATASPSVVSGGQQTGGQLAMSLTRCRKGNASMRLKASVDDEEGRTGSCQPMRW